MHTSAEESHEHAFKKESEGEGCEGRAQAWFQPSRTDRPSRALCTISDCMPTRKHKPATEF
eukprot:361250-Chlamydomonas_euryale.AAC.1